MIDGHLLAGKDAPYRTGSVLRILRAMLGLGVLLALLLPWLAASRRKGLSAAIANRGWEVLLRGFGVRVEVSGTPEPGALFVANHISWTDIPVLACLTGAGFVAKREIGDWPVIGPLARRWGCIMVDRDRRLAVREQVCAVAECLANGPGLVIFPEGTTSDGIGLLPFRSSLLAVAGNLDERIIQPVGITYRNPDGSALTPCDRKRIAWLGEVSLLPHALALAARGGTLAIVWFGPPVKLACRKDAASHCRRVIDGWLAGNQAARLNRVA